MLAVAILTVFTCGLYQIYWFFSTTRELRQHGADLPSAWFMFMFIPIINIWWLARYSEAASLVIRRAYSSIFIFLMMLVISYIMPIILQGQFNRVPRRVELATARVHRT